MRRFLILFAGFLKASLLCNMNNAAKYLNHAVDTTNSHRRSDSKYSLCNGSAYPAILPKWSIKFLILQTYLLGMVAGHEKLH